MALFKDREQALEAGIKYLILASASAAFLLFGMAPFMPMSAPWSSRASGNFR
jgi:NADH:ubiquinone oxidoreductase subunit 2 (subunit N)